MESALINPDVKINMSLDEIIRLNKLQGRNKKGFSGKRGRGARKVGNTSNTSWREHSVPLVSSTEGVTILVSKNSPLLSVQNKKRIAEIFSSRAMNAQLLEKSKKIIPAEYKLIKTSAGVERVLVPVPEYLANRLKGLRNFTPPASTSKKLPDKPPPLGIKPIFQFSTSNCIPMDVDNPNEDILLSPSTPQKQEQEQKQEWEWEQEQEQKQEREWEWEWEQEQEQEQEQEREWEQEQEVIDVESNLPVKVLEAKQLFTREAKAKHNGITSLNDRFTRLSENFWC